jgi:hypothetical protein
MENLMKRVEVVEGVSLALVLVAMQKGVVR